MHNKYFLAFALTFLGACAAPTGSAAGPTLSETIITPFHRTDVVSTPCGQSVLRTTAVPVIPYGISRTDFLGTPNALQAIIGDGFTETGAGVYSRIDANGLMGNLGIGYQGVHGAYSDVGDVPGTGVYDGCLSLYPRVNLI